MATVQNKAPSDPRFQAVDIPLSEFIAEGIRLQHRFKAEPIFATTGVGFLAPSGVDEIAAATVMLTDGAGGPNSDSVELPS